MAYDENLAERVRKVLDEYDLTGLEAKKMFGGVGYLLQGNMACGVHKTFLIVRVGPEHYETALAQRETKEFDITGRAMSGWVMVSAQGCAGDDELRAWVDRGIAFAKSLLPK